MAGNPRAHLDQQLGQVDHLRLAGGVLEHRGALGQRRRHHQVLGAGDGDGVEEDGGPLEAALDPRADVAALDADLRAHGLEAAQVQVHRPRADGAAAGQRDLGVAEAGQQRPQHQDRGAHRLDQLIGRIAVLHLGAIELDRHLLAHHRLHAHVAEQLQGGGDVLQVRQVADGHRLVGQQGGAEDRQGGVLGAADPDLAVDRPAAGDDQLVHGASRLRRRRSPARRPTAPGYRS